MQTKLTFSLLQIPIIATCLPLTCPVIGKPDEPEGGSPGIVPGGLGSREPRANQRQVVVTYLTAGSAANTCDEPSKFRTLFHPRTSDITYHHDEAATPESQ